MCFICWLKMYAYHLNVREDEYVVYLSVEAVCIPFKYESVNMWLNYLSVEAVCIPFKCERV